MLHTTGVTLGGSESTAQYNSLGGCSTTLGSHSFALQYNILGIHSTIQLVDTFHCSQTYKVSFKVVAYYGFALEVSGFTASLKNPW